MGGEHVSQTPKLVSDRKPVDLWVGDWFMFVTMFEMILG